jgi:hypothetical protein
MVICLNRCKSADSRHGKAPSRPMTPFSETAAMTEIRMALQKLLAISR